MRQSSRSRRLLLMARGEMQENNDEPQTSAAVHGAEASGYSYQKFPDLRTYLADDELFQYPVSRPSLPESFELPREYENSYEYLKNVEFDALRTSVCPSPELNVTYFSISGGCEPTKISPLVTKIVKSKAVETNTSSEIDFVDDSDISDKENLPSHATNITLPPRPELDFVGDSDDSVKDRDYVPSDSFPSTSDTNENVVEVPNSFNTESERSPLQNINVPMCENDLGYTKAGHPRKRKIIAMTVNDRAEHNQELKRVKHPIITTEEHKCKKHCPDVISRPERENINRSFWNMTWREQKLFISQRTTSVPPVRRQNQVSNTEPKRKVTLRYSFMVSGQINSVCKAFFLNTLGFKKANNSAIKMALKLEESPNLSDKRGTNPKKKIDRDPIIKHIESFNPAISHYRRVHAPKRRYLPCDMSAQSLYDDFCERNGKTCSYDLYRETVKSMNISFAKLGHEECDQCEKFKIHNLEHMILRHFKCDECKEYEIHMQKAKNARSEYQSCESNEETKYYSADLQKVIMLPRMESIKSVMFCPRLIAFNESFVPVGPSKDPPLAVLWHEAISGRKKEDIVCAFRMFFMEVRDVKNVVLWLDNCAGQNKNWCLLSYIVHLINSDELRTDTITLKYFEPGHTFMSADNFHHQVELSMKKIVKIYDFKDFVTTVEKANSGKVKVQEMNLNDFFVFKDGTAPKKINFPKPRPYLHDIVEIKFTKGEYTFDYKTKFQGNPITLDFIKANIMKNGFPLPKFNAAPRGVTSKRKEDIIKRLGKLMPPNRLKFWQDLPINEKASNLIEEHDN